jgi:predicted CopG family antitoxin
MVKVISLSDEAYGKLRMIKMDRSFSEVVINLVENRKKRNWKDFIGIWKDESKKWEKIKEQIYEDRKKFKLRDYKW